jgi:hypothetical protein
MSIFRRETTGIEKFKEVEGEIREFVRGDRPQPANDGEMVANNIGSLLQRVSMNSVQEIDKLIGELEKLKGRLQHEGERLQREIVEYASLTQAAIQSTKIIAESLNHWRNLPGAPGVYAELPDFTANLRAQEGTATRALSE